MFKNIKYADKYQRAQDILDQIAQQVVGLKVCRAKKVEILENDALDISFNTLSGLNVVSMSQVPADLAASMFDMVIRKYKTTINDLKTELNTVLEEDDGN